MDRVKSNRQPEEAMGSPQYNGNKSNINGNTSKRTVEPENVPEVSPLGSDNESTSMRVEQNGGKYINEESGTMAPMATSHDTDKNKLKNAIQVALSSKLQTFEPKKHEKLPSKKLKPELRARRAQKVRLKLEKRNRIDRFRVGYEDQYNKNNPGKLKDPADFGLSLPKNVSVDLDNMSNTSTLSGTAGTGGSKSTNKSNSAPGSSVDDAVVDGESPDVLRILASLPDDKAKERYKNLLDNKFGEDQCQHDPSVMMIPEEHHQQYDKYGMPIAPPPAAVVSRIADKYFFDTSVGVYPPSDSNGISCSTRDNESQSTLHTGTAHLNGKNYDDIAAMSSPERNPATHDAQTYLDQNRNLSRIKRNDIFEDEASFGSRSNANNTSFNKSNIPKSVGNSASRNVMMSVEDVWNTARDTVFGVENNMRYDNVNKLSATTPSASFSISDVDDDDEYDVERNKKSNRSRDRNRIENFYSDVQATKMESDLRNVNITYDDTRSILKRDRVEGFDGTPFSSRLQWLKQRKILVTFLCVMCLFIFSLGVVFFVDAFKSNTSDKKQSSSTISPRSIPTRPSPPIPPIFNTKKPTNITAGNLETYYTSKEIIDLLGLPAPSDDPNTPRAKALRWVLEDVINNKEMIIGSPISEKRIHQRYALATLYYSSSKMDKNGKTWINDEKWLSEAHECTWFGVRCGSPSTRKKINDRFIPVRYGGSDASSSENEEEVVTAFDHSVTYLKLNANNLFGRIPNEISNLHDLAQLHLYDNFLEGIIPNSITKLTNLHTLFLDNNLITGSLPTIGLEYLSNLVNLDVSSNSLNAEIGTVVGSLSSLAYLRLDNNDLKGNMPEALADLRNLEVFTFGNNLVTGSLPGRFSKLDKLQILHMHENRLSGHIPGFESSFIKEVHADNNEFIGTIPFVPDANNSLLELRLEKNLLTGSLPKYLSDMLNIRILWLDNNNIEGSIPHELGKLRRLQSLRLHGNNLKGEVPESICSLRKEELNDMQATCDGTNPHLLCACCNKCN